jgi:Holliday junction DNA helicase RuvA
MYRYLKGLLVNKDIAGAITVENGGIGYEILTSLLTLEELEVGSEVKVFTKMILREEELILIGFSTPLELEIFELLKTVSGVGIKSALKVLSTLSLSHLIDAVVTEDYQLLTTVPGVGKKSAQRMVIELKDQFARRYALGEVPGGGEGSPLSQAGGQGTRRQEVKEAFASLGYSPREINQILQTLDIGEMEFDAILKEGLKLLLKG